MIFEVIDRKPLVDNQPNCLTKIELNDRIKFDKVTFKYPLAPKEFKNILEEASFDIVAGKSTAIVGASGSGKSTIVQLIERFYDP